MATNRSLTRSANGGIGLHTTEATEPLTLRVQLTSTPAPSEPFREVICQYTDTLCTTQKQTNLINSLLQDIVICNAHDPTKLEEWLTDLETAEAVLS